VYEITDAGRDALREWLRTPPAEPALELDPLMRLLFADAGDRGDLVAALDALDQWAADRYREGREICADYLDGRAPFPERLHISVLFATFYARLYRDMRDWVAEAKAEIDTWPGTAAVGLTPGARRLLEDIVRADDDPGHLG
jgi:hypothetical protein